jgi:anti-sigma regulatory factor (Ser/Thr protein kinase)
MFYSEMLPKSASSAGRARRLLDRLEGQVDPRALANAHLLVSELIANAVEHVAEDGQVGLQITLDDGMLRVEVSDPGPGFTPMPRGPGAPEDSGWGLHFMRLLADRWAAESDGTTRVWFELAAGGPA